MSRSDDLRSSIGPLWEKTVFHPFVTELGDGTLPQRGIQDLFRAGPSLPQELDSPHVRRDRQSPRLRRRPPPGGLRAPGPWEVRRGYSRSTSARKDCPRSRCAAWSASRPHWPTAPTWTRWPTRAATTTSSLPSWASSGPTWTGGSGWPAKASQPDNKYYQTWIDLHAGPDLEGFVTWMRRTLDGADIGDASGLERVFGDVLRYEFLFWEMAYRGEEWPK